MINFANRNFTFVSVRTDRQHNQATFILCLKIAGINLGDFELDEDVVHSRSTLIIPEKLTEKFNLVPRAFSLAWGRGGKSKNNKNFRPHIGTLGAGGFFFLVWGDSRW